MLMSLIIVDDKPYYINEFRDFLELVRNKIGNDAEKYLNNNFIDKMFLIDAINEEIQIEEKECINSCDDFDEGYVQGLYGALNIIEEIK